MTLRFAAPDLGLLSLDSHVSPNVLSKFVVFDEFESKTQTKNVLIRIRGIR